MEVYNFIKENEYYIGVVHENNNIESHTFIDDENTICFLVLPKSKNGFFRSNWCLNKTKPEWFKTLTNKSIETTKTLFPACEIINIE